MTDKAIKIIITIVTAIVDIILSSRGNKTKGGKKK